MSLLQYAEGLSDRQAADQVRARMDWKYLLGLELDDPGFDHTVLGDFRARLITHGLEEKVLTVILDRGRNLMTGMTGGPMVRDTTPRQAIDLRVHRWLMIVGALLTAIALLLLALLPGAPSEAVAMKEWVERGHSLLLWSDELLFFAVICWGAGARGLFGACQAGTSVRINVGRTALTVALVALVVVLLAVGRLVYPVFEIQLSAEAVALVVSSTFGALHLTFLSFAVVAVALSWSTRAGLIGRAAGSFTAAAFVVGSFPWLTPSWWNTLVAVLVAAWGVFLAVATEPRAENPGDATRG